MSYEHLFHHMEGVLRSLAVDAHDPYPESHLEEWRALVAQHAPAAKVESYYQMFEAGSNLLSLNVPCDTFVHVNGHAYCSLSAARQAIQALNTSSSRIQKSSATWDVTSLMQQTAAIERRT